MDLDARMTQIWWVAAIITQDRAASGADKRNAILAPNLLENTSTTFTFKIQRLDIFEGGRKLWQFVSKMST